MKLKSPFGMSPTGVGPKIYASAIPFIVIGCLFPSHSSNILLQLIGICFILLGIIVFILTMIQLIIKFNEGKLATTGAFKFSRNPLYSCWIVFIIPGLALLCLNWWFILGSVSMTITLNIFIKKEENMLLNAFGQEYLDYKKEVGRII
jgi:protein-S-isoprenylcysteine O-methyltransferase Ste14